MTSNNGNESTQSELIAHGANDALLKIMDTFTKFNDEYATGPSHQLVFASMAAEYFLSVIHFVIPNRVDASTTIQGISKNARINALEKKKRMEV